MPTGLSTPTATAHRSLGFTDLNMIGLDHNAVDRSSFGLGRPIDRQMEINDVPDSLRPGSGRLRDRDQVDPNRRGLELRGA